MDNTIVVSLISRNVVRTHVGGEGHPSFAVVKREKEGGEGPIVAVAENTVSARFSDAEERVSYEADGGRIIIRGELGPFDKVYGLGEKALPLNRKRHRVIMWNTDAYGYATGTDPLYVSIPFFIVLRNGRAVGHFVDSPAYMSIDLGQADFGEFTVVVNDEAVDHYIIYGPSIKDVLRSYFELTGKPFLPPKWALGNQQSRYSYYPETNLLAIVDRYRKDELPLSAVYLDIHYMDEYKIFTWDRKRFPDPKSFIDKLHGMGIRVVTIIDPGVKASPTYPVFKSGIDGNYFCVRRNGDLFTSHVWPGLCAFPDFARDDVRDWWGSLVADFVKDGVDGVWLDMNEPAGFDYKDHTVSDEDLMHVVDGKQVPHVKVHNAYALLEAEATYEGMLKARPGKRPFILSRAGYAGIHRYAAIWTGDNTSNWEHLRLQIPILLGLSLSGVPFIGADVGGFAKDTKQGRFHLDPELLVRWYEVAVFTPFLRNHTSIDSPDQEPWAWGSAYEGMIRGLLKLREKLMPYIYSLAWESHELGEPIIRPLVYEFQDDDNVHEIDDEFMLGPHVLLTPALERGSMVRRAYLPKCKWLDIRTGSEVEGGAVTTIDAPLGDPPVLVREGGVVPLMGDSLIVLVYPGNGEFTIYEDDGESMGEPSRLTVKQELRGSLSRIEVGERGASSLNAWVTLSIYAKNKPRRFSINGSPAQYSTRGSFIEAAVRPGSTVELELG